MKCSITKKFKLWITLVISILVVGLAMFGVFGLNQTNDYKTSYEAVVSMDTQSSITTEQFKDITSDYLESKGIETCSATQQIDGPIGRYSIIYKFSKDVNLNKTEMVDYVKSKISDDQLVITVNYNEVTGYDAQKTGSVILALGIAAVVITLYLFIMEGVKSGVSVLISSVLSALLFLALMGITRIPAAPFVTIFGCVAFLLNAVLSTSIVNSAKAQKRLNDASVTNAEKLTSKQLADKAACISFAKIAFIFVGLLVAGILFIALGNVYVKFLGLQLIVSAVCSAFSSLVGTTVTWSLLN